MIAVSQTKSANYLFIVAVLKSMREGGVITQAEYERAKRYYQKLTGLRSRHRRLNVQKEPSKLMYFGIRSCRLCKNLLLCVLSIDFALPLTIMLLEPEKWMVPKCSTTKIQPERRAVVAAVKLISPITRQEIRKIRVAAYCRVSSNSADQQNSYANQIRVYTSLIQRKKEWELVEIFADEGLSGMNAQNRTEFQRMIKMCEQHQIDLIVTKSVSRFARNAKESLEYVRKLKLLGVGVQFEKEGIYTLALGDEMLLNTFSAIAQEESKAISQNQRLSIVKRMQSGEYVDSNAPYGFRLVDKALVIYEPEAAIVRMMFENYLSGQSTSEIARDLNSRGIKTKTGKSTWRSTKVAYILGNERYCGDCKYQKTYRDTTVPFKQFRNRGQEDMFCASMTHAPLIDRDTFDKVQLLLKKRQDVFGKSTTQNIYPLTSRIQCSECGSYFRRRQGFRDSKVGMLQTHSGSYPVRLKLLQRGEDLRCLRRHGQ